MDSNRITEHFEYEEFECPCCNRQWINLDLVHRLERLRLATGRGIWVTSGCRCPDHNQVIGGSRNSYHLNGMAADIVFGGRGGLTQKLDAKVPSGETVYEFILQLFDGVIFYPERNFIHVDVRGYKYSESR
jgi:uncharacterized protein YcbK (DUF882 family)